MKIFKKLDIIIILSLIAISFIPYLIFAKKLSQNYNSTYANIKINGRLYDNIPLSSFKGEKTIVIGEKGHSNTILIKDNTIQIIDADCPDKLCINQGTISKVHDTLVCLPHKLVIEIKGEESTADSNDDLILSH